MVIIPALGSQLKTRNGSWPARTLPLVPMRLPFLVRLLYSAHRDTRAIQAQRKQTLIWQAIETDLLRQQARPGGAA